MESLEFDVDFLIIGGGIAGVSTVETLSYLCPNEKICLLTESSVIKTVVNLVPLCKAISRFDVKEQHTNDTMIQLLNCKIIVDQLTKIDSNRKTIQTIAGRCIHYKLLCLCTGARPKLIDNINDDIRPYVLGIRDTESVLEFQERIKNCHRLAIVGNGGIASEIVYETSNLQIDWIIKDQHIAHTFVDQAAGKFFQTRLTNKETSKSTTIKRMRYNEMKNYDTAIGGSSGGGGGAALGPDWHRNLNLIGGDDKATNSINIHYGCEVNSIQYQSDAKHKLQIKLTNSASATIIDCDLLISATGVVPHINFVCDQEFVKDSTDGGLLVDDMQQTSIDGIYAAGDICTANWQKSEHWFQMRLWTQARQMGSMAGKSMAARFNNNTKIYQDFCFELFGHVTELFGYQVVLLGKYNGQGLNNQYEALIRITTNLEYIKYIIVNGRVKGAILIGETGLEETTENLILNQLDVSEYGDDLLNPNIDIEDYFD